MTDINQVETERESYMDRNGRWIRLIIAGLILALAPLLASAFGSFPIPNWMPWTASAFAFFFGGIMAKITDSKSALITCCVIELIAVLVSVLVVYDLFFA